MSRMDDFSADPSGGGEGLARAAASLRAADVAAQGLSRSLAEGFRGAVREAAAGGARLGDIVRRLSADMAAAGVAAAARPVGDALGRGVAGLVASAVGAAPVAGAVRAFAKGGVVHGAQRFPLGEGAGVAGEAGPEAILPLARGADGRLGVRAGGGGVRVTLNVSTPDADSFARSRGQIAAALARAVALGQRRL